MQIVLLVIQLIVAVALIGCILIQRTAQDGGGLMGGGSTMGGLFTARGSANLLTRTTSILATCFLLNCLVLAYMASHEHRASGSPLDMLGAPKTAQTTGQAEGGSEKEAQKDTGGEHTPVSTTPVSTAVPSGGNSVPAQSAKPVAKGGKAAEGKASTPPQVPIAK